jgi:hypothetical protein
MAKHRSDGLSVAFFLSAMEQLAAVRVLALGWFTVRP